MESAVQNILNMIIIKLQYEMFSPFVVCDHSIYPFTVFLFVGAFFKTIRREWSKIDRLRIDKFYMVSVTLVA